MKEKEVKDSMPTQDTVRNLANKKWVALENKLEKLM